jgi:PAS domain S-box-containing protein
MTNSIHTVLIDDNPDDRALVIRELRREFPGLEAQEITDPSSFAEALQCEGVDLAITDYQLGWSDGLAVLRKVKSRWPDCPVIMFTGSGCEEVAVEAMKAGVDDYILKSPGHLAQLPCTARVALETARQRRTSRQTTTDYAPLFNAVPIGLFRAFHSGRILAANTAFREIVRAPDEDALLATSLAKLHFEPRDFQTLQLLLERDTIAMGFTTRLRCFDGTILLVEINARALRDPGTGQITCEGSIEDVSEAKQAEVSRETLIRDLQASLNAANSLRGLLTICAACKKIRDTQGGWNSIEDFIESHSKAEFTHSLCHDCAIKLYPEFVEHPRKD